MNRRVGGGLQLHPPLGYSFTHPLGYSFTHLHPRGGLQLHPIRLLRRINLLKEPLTNPRSRTGARAPGPQVHPSTFGKNPRAGRTGVSALAFPPDPFPLARLSRQRRK